MVAQSIDTHYKIVKQSGLGVPGSTGSVLQRRTAAVFTAPRATYQNNEIVDHQQSTGATAGIAQTAGKLSTLLSPGSYSILFAALLRKLFTATAAITAASVTIAGSGPTYTVTRAAGSFLTDGFKIGDVFRLSVGTFNAANLSKNLQIVGLTATVATVIVLNSTALVAEGPITGSTLTVVGKKSFVPTTGHTNDYFTVEKWFTILAKSELFTDVKVASASLTIPNTGNITCDFDMPGLARTRGTSEILSSPTAASTTNVVAAVQGKILVNGTITPVTGLTLKIDGQIAPGKAEVGANQISDLTKGPVSVSGSFTAKFTATTIQDIFDNQTTASLLFSAADSLLAAADFISFGMSAINIFSDDDTDATEVERTYNFTAKINQAGGAALANDQTIITIQDSQAA